MPSMPESREEGLRRRPESSGLSVGFSLVRERGGAGSPLAFHGVAKLRAAGSCGTQRLKPLNLLIESLSLFEESFEELGGRRLKALAPLRFGFALDTLGGLILGARHGVSEQRIDAGLVAGSFALEPLEYFRIQPDADGTLKRFKAGGAGAYHVLEFRIGQFGEIGEVDVGVAHGTGSFEVAAKSRGFTVGAHIGCALYD